MVWAFIFTFALYCASIRSCERVRDDNCGILLETVDYIHLSKLNPGQTTLN